MEVLARKKCDACDGSGKRMTEAEAESAARKHNQAASQCNMGGNYLRASDFIYCDDCKGKGKKEFWIEVKSLEF